MYPANKPFPASGTSGTTVSFDALSYTASMFPSMAGAVVAFSDIRSVVFSEVGSVNRTWSFWVQLVRYPK